MVQDEMVCPITRGERILVALDGSEYTDAIVDQAISMGRICNSVIYAISVIAFFPESLAIAPQVEEEVAKKTREFLEIVKKKIEKAYSLIINEEDARVCKDISDDACTFVPLNFFLIILSNTLTKVGDALSNPKTVLAWLMTYVNAPLFLIGFLVPIRESGSMFPQIVIDRRSKRM